MSNEMSGVKTESAEKLFIEEARNYDSQYSGSRSLVDESRGSEKKPSLFKKKTTKSSSNFSFDEDNSFRRTTGPIIPHLLGGVRNTLQQYKKDKTMDKDDIPDEVEDEIYKDEFEDSLDATVANLSISKSGRLPPFLANHGATSKSISLSLNESKEMVFGEKKDSARKSSLIQSKFEREIEKPTTPLFGDQTKNHKSQDPLQIQKSSKESLERLDTSLNMSKKRGSQESIIH